VALVVPVGRAEGGGAWPEGAELYLHPLHRVGGGVGLLQEVGVLHVLGQPLQEAQGLVEHHRHGDLRQLLENKRCVCVCVCVCGEVRDQRQTHNIQ